MTQNSEFRGTSNVESGKESLFELRKRLFEERKIRPPKTEELKQAFGSGDALDQVLWKQYVGEKENGIPERFQIWTEEYVDKLSDHLTQRVKELWPYSGGQPIRISEVGEGDGLLSKFLKQKLQLKVPEAFQISAPEAFQISASDLNSKEDRDQVQKASVYKSLRKEKPDIVISSWMPLNEDWTAAFVDAGVSEYILIGEEASSGIPYFTMNETPGFFARKQLQEADNFNVNYYSGNSEFLDGVQRIRSRTYAFTRLTEDDLRQQANVDRDLREVSDLRKAEQKKEDARRIKMLQARRKWEESQVQKTKSKSF